MRVFFSPLAVACLATTALLIGCGAPAPQTKPLPPGMTEEPPRGPAEAPPPPPPNTVRVRATIISIDTTFHITAHDHPCNKYPCKATVRIDSIFAYGMAFGMPLHEDQELTVQFIYSLAPTSVAFPRLKPELPGLKLKSEFAADIEAHEIPGQHATQPAMEYTIFRYEPRQ